MSETETFKQSPLSQIDGFGSVYLSGSRVLRAIRPESVPVAQRLLNSGLLGELESRGYVPKTWQTEVKIDGYGVVLEHERIAVVSYPFEWTYGMLRDAGELVLRVNQIAQSYGWELKDAHGFNILFDGPTPKYVDIGSIVPLGGDCTGWPSLEEWVRFYEYPLRIWREGGSFIARRVVAASDLMTHGDFGLYRSPWVRIVGYHFYQKIVSKWYQFRRLSRASDEQVRSRLPKSVATVLTGMRRRRWLPLQAVNYSAIRRRVIDRKRQGGDRAWSRYQENSPEFIKTHRFQRIVEIVKSLELDSVLELGGNQGWLSEELLRRQVVKMAISTDFDEKAVDLAYERSKSSGLRLNLAVLDFVNPMVSPFGEPPHTRYQADGVLALAVTHHLLLSQCVPIAQMFAKIALYTKRAVIIEFMPLGLWDGVSAKPYPDWYNIDTFRSEFKKVFSLKHEESLEVNRHVFCGELLTGTAKQ